MVADLSKEELEHLVLHNEHMAKERKISDEKYAEKRVEKVVYSTITIVLVAVVGAVLRMAVN